MNFIYAIDQHTMLNLKRMCKGKCTEFRVKKPALGGRYEAGHGRCQICDVWIDYHGAHLKNGSPAAEDSEGWICNCCNYRIRRKPRNRIYKEKLQVARDPSSIPKYHQLMLPILQFSQKRQTVQELEDAVVDMFNLTEQERGIVLRKTETYLRNRIYWATLYLRKAGLLVKEDDRYHVTENGHRILEHNPSKIDKEFLMHIPMFASWINKSDASGPNTGDRNAHADYASIFDEYLERIRPSSSYQYAVLYALTDVGTDEKDSVGRRWITEYEDRVRVDLNCIAIRFIKYYWETIGSGLRHTAKGMVMVNKKAGDVNIIHHIKEESLQGEPNLKTLAEYSMHDFRKKIINKSMKPEVLRVITNNLRHADNTGIISKAYEQNSIEFDNSFLTFLKNNATKLKDKIGKGCENYLKTINQDSRLENTSISANNPFCSFFESRKHTNITSENDTEDTGRHNIPNQDSEDGIHIQHDGHDEIRILSERMINEYAISRIDKALKRRLTAEFVNLRSMKKIMENNPHLSKEETKLHVRTSLRLPETLRLMENAGHLHPDPECSLQIALFAVNYHDWDGEKRDEEKTVRLAQEISRFLTSNMRMRDAFSNRTTASGAHHPPVRKNTGDISTAVAVWIAAATLHQQYGINHHFSNQDILNQVIKQGLTGVNNATIQMHISSHCVANNNAMPNKHRKLYRASRGRYRLYRNGDYYNHSRAGGQIAPLPIELPEQYRDLSSWYENEFCAGKSRTTKQIHQEDDTLNAQRLVSHNSDAIPEPGKMFTERELQASFKVGKIGGIRPSAKSRIILLISTDESNIHHNNTQEDFESIDFVGEDQEDQIMTKNNKSVIMSKEYGYLLLYFVEHGKGPIEFKCSVEYVSHYFGKRKNNDGELRRTIVFNLKKL